MPLRSLPSRPSLEHLKYQARDLLEGLHSRRKDALARVREFHLKATRSGDPEFSLADAQLVIAREYGFASWPKLKKFVDSQALGDSADSSHFDTLVRRFLEFACPDHHVRGGPAHMMARDAALQLLKRNPSIARHNLYTAVVCGELEEVKRILSDDPSAASRKFSASGPDRSGVGHREDVLEERGPKNWEPLLYLCFTRLPIAAVTNNAVAIARLLLDSGADPNACFMAGDSRYTPLVGVIGEGEESRPSHPQREALTRLLLERGAEPYDMQVVYNIHFHGQILWFMELMYEHSVRRGRKADWDDPEWSMLGMGNYGSGARWHLDIAVKHDNLALAEWLLAHGANPNATPARDRRFPQGTLYQAALRRGLTGIAGLLARYGADTGGVTLTSGERFLAACFRLDRDEAVDLLREHPEYLSASHPLMFAAERDRADVAALLLDLGVSPDIANPQSGNQRALHVCAWNDSPRVAELLIRRGAEIDAQESHYGATPLGFAIWSGKTRMIDLLRRVSRNIWSLAFLGEVDRLRLVLAEEPQLANALSPNGETPLMRLPGDEDAAVAVAKLLLEYGGDPRVKSAQGLTAVDLAGKRGLNRVANLLNSVRSF